jgi:ferrochelatase
MTDHTNVSHDPADELIPSVLPREPEPPPLAPALGEGSAREEASDALEAAPGTARIGVLLVNLGTPDAANAAAVRRYLKEFLTDPRVIEKNSLLWKIVLNGVILPFRSRRKVRDYRKIWNRERDESPLKTITRSQAEQLANLLKPIGKHIVVDWAMRYAAPSIASRLAALVERGCDRILIMPLYPQYAAPTTATVGDEVFRFLMKLRRQPALRIMPAYFDDLDYIGALASSLETGLAAFP